MTKWIRSSLENVESKSLSQTYRTAIWLNVKGWFSGVLAYNISDNVSDFFRVLTFDIRLYYSSIVIWVPLLTSLAF
jgi:hypothetical protein